jgi:hypothetical protein
MASFSSTGLRKCVLCGAFPLTDAEAKQNLAAHALLDAALELEAEWASLMPSWGEYDQLGTIERKLYDAARAFRAAKEGT